MKKWFIIVPALILAVGLPAGYGGYMVGKSKAAGTTQTASPKPAQAGTQAQKNLYNGDELTLVEMYDSLKSTSGRDFDQRMLVYLLTINNLETGMLRMADTKAERPPLKDFAKVQMEQNAKVIPLLNQWQSDWGFSDH